MSKKNTMKKYLYANNLVKTKLSEKIRLIKKGKTTKFAVFWQSSQFVCSGEIIAHYKIVDNTTINLNHRPTMYNDIPQ